jgi:hypothetical protein
MLLGGLGLEFPAPLVSRRMRPQRKHRNLCRINAWLRGIAPALPIVRPPHQQPELTPVAARHDRRIRGDRFGALEP